MSRADVKNLELQYGKRKRLTRAQAIRAQCIECMGYEQRYVADCPAKACPLWPYRSGLGEEPSDVPIRRG
jgi:hypothetical protein